MRQFYRAAAILIPFAWLGVSVAQASGINPGDTIIGVFSDPVVIGNVINTPYLGASTSFNNTGTAYSSITNSAVTTVTGSPAVQTVGSSLIWGNTPGFSELIFFGSTIPSNVDIHTTPFLAGTLTFQNGTSALTSLIFGASLSFYVNSAAPENFLGTDSIIITTTSNLGQNTFQDADYINICGNSSNICGQSIQANENGTGITATLMATIIGDPMLAFTSVTVTGDGNLGAQLPLGAVPEPSTWAMMIIGFVGVGVMAYRRKRDATAARAAA